MIDKKPRQIHHAMYTTGAVNIYHVIQEVSNVTRHHNLALFSIQMSFQCASR
jgi:hypothetical protein